MGVEIPDIIPGISSEHMLWFVGEITPAVIVFSRTINDAVETHPEGVVTSTSIVIEEV